jgi:hypothetical protein
VITFDDGAQSESNTLLLTDRFAHTPPEVLAKNFGVAQESCRCRSRMGRAPMPDAALPTFPSPREEHD